MTHDIILESEVDLPDQAPPLIHRVIQATLAQEGVGLPCEISVLLTDDQGIQEINQEMRDLDQATDVLSFPMFSLVPGQPPGQPPGQAQEDLLDPETGLLPLGDMVLSLERVQAQGEEFGHGFFQELAYLTIHSVLHLLGYDHLDQGPEKQQMRSREKEILASLGDLPPRDETSS